MFCPHYQMGYDPPKSTIEGGQSHLRETKTFTRTRICGDKPGQTTKNRSRGNLGGRKCLAIMGQRQRRLGFLNGPSTLWMQAYEIICGISRKRKKELRAGTSIKVRRLTVAIRPVINMILHQDGRKHQVRALLDAGCSIALINNKSTE